MLYTVGAINVIEEKGCRYVIFNREPTQYERQYLMRDESMIRAIFWKKGTDWEVVSASSVVYSVIETMYDGRLYGSLDNYIKSLDMLLRIRLEELKLQTKL